jgi:ribosomal protein L37AE/L43A
MHGGAKGSGGPPGQRNGNYRHGLRTRGERTNARKDARHGSGDQSVSPAALSVRDRVFYLPEPGRSTVFIPPRSLDFGVASRRRIACGEGSVKRISGNQCAQCGAVLIAPEWSEHFPDHRVRNVWSCKACGYEFEDTVYWSARELVDAD